MVIAGIVLIFLGALLFPLAANLTTNNRPPLDRSAKSRGDARASLPL